jgi:hypothetical protein
MNRSAASRDSKTCSIQVHFRRNLMRRSVLITLSLAATLSAGALVPSAAIAQYGPDTCRQGFVWREAYAGDHACVRPWARGQVANDNAAAPGRILGNGRCLQGYVWREAYPGDHVCVTPDIRDRTATQTQRAPYRRAYD